MSLGIIPAALINDLFGPFAVGDLGDFVGEVDQGVPRGAAGIDDGLFVVVDPVGEKVLAQVLPDVLDRVELRRVARQRQQCDSVGDIEASAVVPAGLVEDDDGMGARRDVMADLLEVLVHGPAVGMGQDEGGADIALGAHGTEQIGGGVASVARCARAAAARRPDPGQRALLADPGFVLEPHLDRLAGGAFRQRGAHQLGEVFLNACCFCSSASG